MTLLYVQGFEGFSITGDRTDLDVEYDFDDSVDTTEAGLVAGRTGGIAGFITNNANVSTMFLLPVAGLSSEDDWIMGIAFRTVFNYFRGVSIAPPLIQFIDPNNAVMLSVLPRVGTFRVQNGSNTVLGTADVSITTYVWHYLEVKVNLNSTTGSVVLRLNNEEILNVTGVNTVGSSAFTRPGMIGFGNSGDSVKTEVDDIYICDDQGSSHNDFLGDGAVRRLNPNAVGDFSQFTNSGGGDNYQDVDETDPDGDTTYVESRVAGQKDTYNFQDITDDPASISSVTVKSFVKKTDAGARTFVHVARSSSTELDSAVIYPSAVTYRYMASQFPTDPATSAAWTKAGLNAAQFGFKVDT